MLLVLSGGFGMGPVAEILAELDKAQGQFQTLVVTGRNEELRRELRELLQSCNLPGTVELFLYRRSYGAGDTSILLEGLRGAHRAVIGNELELAAPVFSSMWRDVLIFNEMGIPSITYGTPRAFRKQAMTIGDLVRAAHVYARIAIDVCGREKPSVSTQRTSP